jgi:hypothetical protein
MSTPVQLLPPGPFVFAEAERAAAENGVEVLGLHRFALQGKCIDGLLMGFAAFAESEIGQAIVNLAAALERRHRSERKPRQGRKRQVWLLWTTVLDTRSVLHRKPRPSDASSSLLFRWSESIPFFSEQSESRPLA